MTRLGVRMRVSAHLAWQGVSDPLRRARLIWLATSWVITALLSTLGWVYLVGGYHVVSYSPSFAIFGHFVPGALHTHGAAMVLLSFLLTVGLSAPIFGRQEPREMLHGALLATFAYFVLTALCFALAGAVPGGKSSVSGTIIWLVLAALPLVLMAFPPPWIGSRDESVLFAMAMRHGLGRDAAKQLARDYLYGGGRG